MRLQSIIMLELKSQPKSSAMSIIDLLALGSTFHAKYCTAE